jgi:outer membrane protein OmpA-like peptidoglycan-associated protein
MTNVLYSALIAVLLVASPLPATAQATDNLKPSDPVVCGHNDDLTIRGRLIETPGNGVEIQGNCDVVLVNSRIIAGGVGVLVRGNGEVEIQNSYVEGGTAAILVEGLGEAYYRDSTIRGDLRSTSMAELHDEGGNDIEGSVGRAPTSVTTSGSGTVRVGDVEVTDQGVRVGPPGAGIEVSEDGVIVGGHQEVAIRDDGSVVVDSGGSQVVVDGDYVRIESPGTSVQVTGGWRERGSSTYSRADTDRVLVDLNADSRDGELHLNLAGDVLFDFDSSAIRPSAAAELQKVAHVIRMRSAGEIYVVGHTDSVGGDPYNQKLSEARAISVMRWLNENEEIPLALMKGRGMGSKKPLTYNTMPDGSDNPEGRAKNRRVEIRFVSQS